MSERSVNLTTLFLGRLGPPKRLTSTSFTHFRQYSCISGNRNEILWPDGVSNQGSLALEPGALPTALRGPATEKGDKYENGRVASSYSVTIHLKASDQDLQCFAFKYHYYLIDKKLITQFGQSVTSSRKCESPLAFPK